MKHRKVYLSDDRTLTGKFLEWGTEPYFWNPSEGSMTAFGVTVALIELDDGKVMTRRPENIEFVEETWLCVICKEEGGRFAIKHRQGCENGHEG